MAILRTDTKILTVKFHNAYYEIEKHGDWFDLRNVETVKMEKGDFKYISLGISVVLPVGYEAIIAPRSSTFKRYGIIMPNSLGIIDENYCGNDDIWHFPAYCLAKSSEIPEYSRICQFRIVEHQPSLSFKISTQITMPNRGGLGSTGQ